ncbi:MAG: hypothetical protein ACUVXJ_03415 [Phycisphaerae bacterium]
MASSRDYGFTITGYGIRLAGLTQVVVVGFCAYIELGLFCAKQVGEVKLGMFHVELGAEVSCPSGSGSTWNKVA